MGAMRGLVATFLVLFAINGKVHGQNDKLQFKLMTLPVVNLTAEQVAAYEADPKNKPKMDGPMPKKGNPQPSTAGTSYLATATQIIGGSRATQTQFPWQIYLIADKGWLCGGSLIAANWVLTAAHCVDGGRTFTITAGGIDRLTTETNEKTQSSKKVVKHAKYSRTTLVNDIAVIQVGANFALNNYVNVIRLPKPSQATSSFADSAVTASGYGMTANTGAASSYMNFVSLTVITNSLCAKTFGTRSVVSTTICTAADAAKSICSGDSGGPLMLKESDGKFTQVGVVSFGASASCTNYPAGYSRVTSYLSWIATNTGVKTSG